MSELNPYEILGVTENASFEEIQKAKDNLIKKNENNPPVVQKIEVAYDSVIMQRLKLRQEGKIKVPETIRFPEKQIDTRPLQNLTSNPATEKISSWFTDLLDQPELKEVAVSGIIFLILIFVSIFNPNPETLPLLLTIGVGTGFFVLYRKQKLFWRSVGITFLSFILGIIFSELLFFLFSNANLTISLAQEQFASLLTFCILWLTSNFLR